MKKRKVKRNQTTFKKIPQMESLWYRRRWFGNLCETYTCPFNQPTEPISMPKPKCFHKNPQDITTEVMIIPFREKEGRHRLTVQMFFLKVINLLGGPGWVPSYDDQKEMSEKETTREKQVCWLRPQTQRSWQWLIHVYEWWNAGECLQQSHPGYLFQGALLGSNGKILSFLKSQSHL